MKIVPATSTPRRYSRVVCNAAAVLVDGDETRSGICENLSIGGAYVKGAAVPSPRSVTLTLCLPSMGPVELTGEICHLSQEGCGIRFTRIPSQALVALCAFVGGRSLPTPSSIDSAES